MSHTDRQAKKAIMFGLQYGRSGKSVFMRMLIEEQIKMMASMAVSRNTGIGYIDLEQPDFSSLELRLLNQVHDETQWQVVDSIEPERYYTANQRGRHWDRKRRPQVVEKKQDPLEAMAFALHAQFMMERFGPYHNPIHQMGEIQKPPHRLSVYGQIVQHGGKLQLMKNTWYNWLDGYYKDYKDYSF